MTQQRRQLDAQAQQQVDVMAWARGLEAFCQRRHPPVEQMTFAQRRQLVALLSECVLVNDGPVEIRYVVPTGPQGETTPFCHWRLDYFNGPAFVVRPDHVCGGEVWVVGHQSEELPRSPLAREDDVQAAKLADLPPPGIDIAVPGAARRFGDDEGCGAVPPKLIPPIAASGECPAWLEEAAMALERGSKVKVLLAAGLDHGRIQIVGIKQDHHLDPRGGLTLPNEVGR